MIDLQFLQAVVINRGVQMLTRMEDGLAVGEESPPRLLEEVMILLMIGEIPME